uniref:Uncharacterized protein n=1 Tax=Arundo donax TaxID=35708 RepID=A0A0A9DEV9_ARUDO
MAVGMIFHEIFIVSLLLHCSLMALFLGMYFYVCWRKYRNISKNDLCLSLPQPAWDKMLFWPPHSTVTL